MRHVTVSVLLGFLLSVTGCGPGEATVSGTVTLDGKPLDEGNIAFRPLPASAQSEAMGGPIKAGKYQIKALPGQNRVEITAARAAPGPKDPLATGAPPVSIIPAKYNSQSELTEEVRAGGANELNFVLTSH